MRHAWTCSSVGTRIPVADSFKKRGRVWVKKVESQTPPCLQADCWGRKQHHMRIHHLGVHEGKGPQT